MKHACRLSRALLLAALVMSTPRPVSAQPPAEDHGAHQHTPAQTPPAGGSQPAAQTSAQPDVPGPVQPPTDGDRRAAFPEVEGHTLHDNQFRSFILFDQLEWQQGQVDGANWDVNGWLGYDRDRVWVRSEGDTVRGRLDRGEAHVLYGRAFARWWDVVAGVRQDVRPAAAQTWGAFGLQGLAPYWFEVQATAYVGPDWRTQFRFETQYEFFITNRVTLQPLLELRVNGKADPDRGLGAGLSSADYGLRLRYIVKREIAPYLGLTWSRLYFGTASAARSSGSSAGDTRLAFGLRLWI